MLQRYKLRLGDGTVLLVDHDGLGTWLVDKKATVQAGGSRNWIPLRKFLAKERAAHARRARQEAAAWSALPPDAPPRRADGLPLTPPPPKTPPPDAPSPREDGLPLTPPPPPREAEGAERTPPPPVREDGLPLVPPPLASEPVTVETPSEPAPPAGPVRFAEPEPVRFIEDAPPEPGLVVTALADEVPVVVPTVAAESAPADGASAPFPVPLADEIAPPNLGPASEPPLVPPPAPLPAEPNPVVMPEAEVAPLAVAFVDEAPPAPAPEPDGLAAPGEEEETTVDLSSLAEEVAAEEPVPSAPVDLASPTPPAAEEEIAPAPEAPVSVTVGAPLVVQARPEESVPLNLPPLPPAASDVPVSSPLPSEPHEITQVTGLDGSAVPQESVAGVRTLAEEPVTARPLEDVTELPVVPLKPLVEDDGPRRTRRNQPPQVWSDAADVEPAHPRHPPAPTEAPGPGILARLDLEGRLGEGFWQRGRAASVHRFLASAGALFSRCLAPINRLERGQPLFPAEAAGAPNTDPVPRSTPVIAPAPPHPSPPTPVQPLAEEPELVAEEVLKVEDLPVVPLKPSVDEGATRKGPSASQKILARAKDWWDKPTAWASRLTESPSSPISPVDPVSARATARPLGEAVRPPRPVSELPVVPLAEALEPAPVEDVYEGDVAGEYVEAAWLWTKRLVMLTALGGAAFLAFSTYESWSEPAAEIGQTTLTEIDGHVRTLDLIRQRQEAVTKVEPELPHLSSERISHLMVLSSIGLLDAKGVFEAAWIAAERGTPRLPEEEALELQGVQTELLEGLFPAERDWLRDYDRARFRGAVFPFDAQQAHIVYARGVRRLSPESQETLRLRLDEAIALGLEPQESGAVLAD